MREFPSDIVLGGNDEPGDLLAPVPPNSLALPSLMPGGLPRDEAPGPTVAPVACPEADVFAVPGELARSNVTVPPVEATYEYRNEGTFEIGGANTMRGSFPDKATRQVTNVDRGALEFTFDVVATLGQTVTTASYHVVPVETGSQFPGIFLTKMTTKDGGAAPSTFDPTPDLEFLRFPVEPGTSWQSTGVDSTTLQGVAFGAVVESRVRLDACGSILDAFRVRVNGNFVQCVAFPSEAQGTPAGNSACPGIDLGARGVAPASGAREQFSGTYLWGTQYGGLVLSDTVDIITDLPSGVTVARKNTASITTTPKTP